jgi:chromosome segregation ATPase
MALFGLRKKKEVKEAGDVLKDLEKEEKILEKKEPEAESMPPEPKVEKEKPDFAPLFVRINKYRQILQTMNYLKTTVNATKSTLSVLKELDKMRRENLKILEGAIDKVNQRLMTLDSNFMRPSGYVENVPEFRDVESLGPTLEELKGQIDQLKSQIESLA